MSTRKTQDGSFHQNKYASSPEFERGLLANLIAKRAAVLDCRENRELVWAIHFFSHQDGGLAAVARDLIASFPDQIGTREMLATNKSGGQNYSADEIRKIRLSLPSDLRSRFPLKGETRRTVRGLHTQYDRFASAAEQSRALLAAAEEEVTGTIENSLEDIMKRERERWNIEETEIAAKHPTSYPVAALKDLCLRAAKEGIAGYQCPDTSNLERTLAEMCLNPGWSFEAGGPWYFAGLIGALREYIGRWTARKCDWPETKLGRIVAEEFDYTWQSRCLSLLTGEARRGKSFAAKICCQKFPGRARLVETPPGNDDTSFFRTLARGLGLGNLSQYSTTDVRDRVETVLLSGDLILVLDESQRLFPERTRYAYPSRITWLMTMANAKVPILMISTPQFTDRQRLAEKGGWNSAQLTGRIFNYKVLPSDLDESDLMAVCRAVLPEASEQLLKVLASYAQMSARYLSAVESIAMRARYLAGRAGRTKCNAEDVRVAMKASVIPSDTRLNAALETSRTDSRRRYRPTFPDSPEAHESPSRERPGFTSTREIQPNSSTSPSLTRQPRLAATQKTSVKA